MVAACISCAPWKAAGGGTSNCLPASPTADMKVAPVSQVQPAYYKHLGQKMGKMCLYFCLSSLCVPYFLSSIICLYQTNKWLKTYPHGPTQLQHNSWWIFPTCSYPLTLLLLHAISWLSSCFGRRLSRLPLLCHLYFQSLEKQNTTSEPEGELEDRNSDRSRTGQPADREDIVQLVTLRTWKVKLHAGQCSMEGRVNPQVS